MGSLRYLAHTQPDLTFSVGYVSRFMQRPTTEHQQAVKRIIRYVAGTLDHGLYCPRCPGAAHFVGYSDSDHASDIDTSKSTSGILFFLSKCLVSWQSVKQQVVALSSCETDKHIRVRYHFIRDCLEEWSIKASYINTKDQLADLLTKPLGRIKFFELCSRTGMVQLSHKTTHKT
ncbi:secreted RxLR effector protein 161-like [Miscanthus floridulus]|uniref:secreted RxLR effector protein 161-like n=1 Tax=Miscanthus floridulus TaxID=154761 RepID=UPI0034596D3E